MRVRELLTEAARNLATSTTRALTFALALVAVLLVTVGMDQASVTTTRIAHHQFRADGATLWVLASPDGIDAGRCEALAGLRGVVGAGAVRAGDDVRLALLPSTTTRVADVSTGLRTILAITRPATSGVWISPSLSESLGADPGETLTLEDGSTVTIADRYAFPEAVSSSTLSSALAAPAPTTGLWDECWLDLETYDEATTASMTFSLVPAADDLLGGQAQLTQLNGSHGRSHNLPALLAERPTRWLLLAAPVLAALVGAISVRTRRLEHAAARHVGVTRTDLAATTAVESAVWAITAALLTVAVVAIVHVALMASAGLDPRTDLTATLADTARPASLAAAAATVAATLTSLTNKPRQLYRYFRERQ